MLYCIVVVFSYFQDLAANCIREIPYISTTTKMGSSRHRIPTRDCWVRNANVISVPCAPPNAVLYCSATLKCPCRILP